LNAIPAKSDASMSYRRADELTFPGAG